VVNLKRIIVISPDYIGEKMAGPGIRYWNIANELSKQFEVILFTPNKCELFAEFSIKQVKKDILVQYALNASCIILQGITLWAHPYLKKIDIPIAVDLYDPFVLENLELDYHSPDVKALHKASLAVLIDQLSYGDYFFCASEKQKDFWIGMLTALNRINPVEYSIDKTLNHLIGIVPFGMPKEEPNKNKQVLKGVHQGISNEDKVIIWGGGVWNWLDPLTAIKAINILSEKRTDIKLFFMGINHPNPDILKMKMLNETMELSSSLNLTNKFVFFNDWVEYNDRHNYLLESDIGLSLHFNHLETRFSFRTRILDYIWCRLPIVSTSGDVMSELVNKFQVGKVVSPENPEELAQAIELVLDIEKKEYRNSFLEAAKSLSWERSVEPLISFCHNPVLSHGKGEKLIITQLVDSRFKYYFVKGISLIKKGDFLSLLKKIKNKF
jgi:glycosyltransferase involved in cell wall biosynthesis